jgi:hypothetical protein
MSRTRAGVAVGGPCPTPVPNAGGLYALSLLRCVWPRVCMHRGPPVVTGLGTDPVTVAWANLVWCNAHCAPRSPLGRILRWLRSPLAPHSGLALLLSSCLHLVLAVPPVRCGVGVPAHPPSLVLLLVSPAAPTAAAVCTCTGAPRRWACDAPPYVPAVCRGSLVCSAVWWVAVWHHPAPQPQGPLLWPPTGAPATWAVVLMATQVHPKIRG